MIDLYPYDDATREQMLAEGEAIFEAIRKATREAVLRHKRLGHPVASWKDSKVVWIAPEDIQVPDESAAE